MSHSDLMNVLTKLNKFIERKTMNQQQLDDLEEAFSTLYATVTRKTPNKRRG